MKLKLGLVSAVIMLSMPTIAMAADVPLLDVFAWFAQAKEILTIATAGQFATWMLFSLLGVIVHVGWDIKKGIIIVAPSGGFISTLAHYLFVDRVAASIAMVASVMALGLAWFSAASDPINIWSLIMAAATAGYTSDSMFNRTSEAL